MAIVRTAGTEIIRSASFEDVDSTRQDLIIGVQHHIYTVLSIIITCTALQAVTNKFILELEGYDSKAGTTNEDMKIFESNLALGETFVWNDKFSFNGYEPANFTGPMDDATKQDAIADQGSSVAQKLKFSMTSADGGGQDYDVHITYIDQNNA